MLEVQKFLFNNNGNLQELTDKFGIIINKHPSDNRLILNYHQIDSYKNRFHNIVCECRGLVLDSTDFSIVAKGFNRFFNLGEHPDDEKFNWEKCQTYEKVDGSYIALYNWGGKWRVNTRNSFGDGVISQAFNQTWQNLVFEILKRENVELDKLDVNFCYILELCSRYNKVVRDYPIPQLFHLGTFNICDGQEVFREIPNIKFPVKYEFSSKDDVLSFLKKQENDDHTFEGVVLNDGNKRIKVKSQSYLQLHTLSNNGNLFHLNSLVPWLLREGPEEICVYFKEREEYIRKVDLKINKLLDEIYFLWEDVKQCSSKKEISKHSSNKIPLFNMLYSAYDRQTHPKNVIHLYQDTIIKLMKNEQEKN